MDFAMNYIRKGEKLLQDYKNEKNLSISSQFPKFIEELAKLFIFSIIR